MLVIVVGLAVFQYCTSDKLALAASGREVVSPEEAPELHAMVERLCAMADLPKPRIAVDRHRRPERVRDRPQPEARGRRGDDRASGSGSSRGRSRACSRTSSPTSPTATCSIMTVASFFAMLAAMLTRFGLYGGMFGGFGGGRARQQRNNQVPVWLIVLAVSIVTYALSFILIRTISRYREYAADRGSALITGAPEHLMSALQKISSHMTQIPQRDLREVAGMNAFFIVPTNWQARMSASCSWTTRRWRSASPRSRDRPRDGPPRRVARNRCSFPDVRASTGLSVRVVVFVLCHRPVHHPQHLESRRRGGSSARRAPPQTNRKMMFR